MDDALLEIVFERLVGNPLPVEAEALLLAAFESDQALATQLNAPPAQRRAHQVNDTAAKDPDGAYLRSLTVKGFRGIGPAATLEVSPGPGLTLVVGRNGSGKSSFAEALEVLLTGTLMRWAPPAPVVVRGVGGLSTRPVTRRSAPSFSSRAAAEQRWHGPGPAVPTSRAQPRGCSARGTSAPPCPLSAGTRTSGSTALSFLIPS